MSSVGQYKLGDIESVKIEVYEGTSYFADVSSESEAIVCQCEGVLTYWSSFVVGPCSSVYIYALGLYVHMYMHVCTYILCKYECIIHQLFDTGMYVVYYDGMMRRKF